MKPLEPIYTVELFPPLSRELLRALRSLHPADWARPTACPSWTVKDVAAHLLGGSLGRLWHTQKTAPAPVSHTPDFDELLAWIDQSNALWVQAAQRISPEMLVEFLELTDRHLYHFFKSLDQDEPAAITVAWASDASAPNWFDIAREYTEKWLHQQHIREATDQPLLTARHWLHPVLDTFIRALPRTFRNAEAAPGASVSVQILGEAGGDWLLVRDGAAWQLFTGQDPRAVCRVQLEQDLAWRLFTKGVDPDSARRQVRIEGDATLGETVLEMVSIMA